MAMHDHDYAHERDVAEAVARDAGALIRLQAGHFNTDSIREKRIHDLVTDVDEAAERLIVERLQEAFPEDAILAEESAGERIEPHAGRRWIIDPLDGTTNFMHGVSPYAVSIALQDGGEGVLGVVYDVPHDELFVAVRGQGVTVNGVPGQVSETETLENSLIATGFPFRDYRYVEGFLETFETLIRTTRGLRRHGAAAVDLAWVACGRFDGFFEAGLAPWDTAAGIVLVQEGGGTVSSLPSGYDPVFDGGLIASNGRIHGGMVRAAKPLGTAYRTALAEG